MADLTAFKDLIKISAFGGMNTNSPQGYVKTATYNAAYQWRPYRLENADFSRAPGLQCQPAASLQIASASVPQSALVGADLFYYDGGLLNTAYYDSSTRTSTPIPGTFNNGTGASIMPGVLAYSQPATQPPLTFAGASRRPAGGLINQYAMKGGVYAAGGGTGVPGGDISVTYVASGAGETGFPAGSSYEFMVLYSTSQAYNSNRFAGQRYYYFVNSINPAGAGISFLPVIDYLTGLGKLSGAVWWRASGTDAWKVGLASTSTGFVNGKVQQVSVGLSAGAGDYFVFGSDPLMPREYHQGRIFISPSFYQYFDGSVGSSGIAQDSVPNRLFYSSIIAKAGNESLPAFSIANYIDIPFVVSKRIVAIKSTGRYLYIFGDRELFILNGNSDRDFQLESLGDSLGAISGASVQRLGTSVYYMSDSGVMKVSGGTVTEVGEDVRPTLLAMNFGSMSSTVDFGAEVYYLQDGTQTLMYWVREDAWTFRKEFNSPLTLIYGGGTPYGLSSGTGIYALNGIPTNTGTLPPWLPIFALFSPHEFDGWGTRKVFRELLLGYESPAACSLALNAFVNEGGAAVNVSRSLPSNPYSKRVAFGLLSTSGYQLGFTLTLTPPARPSQPPLLVPPLSITGQVKGEQPV